MGLTAGRRTTVPAALLCVLAAGCGHAAAAPSRTHASFTAGGVRVTVTLERQAAHTVAVTAMLSPRQKGFHVYSLTLPDQGVDGLGIPTRLAVGAPLTAEGEVTASAHPYGLRPAGLGVTLPVYPDGPVTLRLTTRVTSAAPGTVQVRLTYGACSTTGGCLVPVRAHPVTVPVPPS